MRLRERLDELERRRVSDQERWMRVFRYEDQTKEQAIAAHEAEHGPINKGVTLRVIIRKPFPAPSYA